MAYANNIGWNEILELGKLSFAVGRRQTAFCTSLPLDPSVTMDTKSKIPKFSFSIRKSGTGNGDKKASQGSSLVGRSKSMKVQRTTVSVVQRKTKHSNSIDNDEAVEEAKATLLQAPTSRRTDNPRSQPNSRSTTPSMENSSGSFTKSISDSSGSSYDSLGRAKAMPTSRFQDSGGMRTHLRSSSFSSREKYGVVQPSANGSGRRPTVNSRLPDHKSHPKGVSPSSETSHQFKRVLSNSKPASHDETDSSTESPVRKPGNSGVLRNPDSRRSSTGSQGGRRPSSMISYTEKSSDLNQLASEITQMENSGVFGSTSPRMQSVRTHISPVRPVQTTSYPQDTTKGGSKLRPPICRNTSDEGNRPSSVTANYHRIENRGFFSRPKSATDVHRVVHQPQSIPTTVVMTSRSSTPSSGRDTPQHSVHKEITEEEEPQPIHKKIVSTVTSRRPLAVQTRPPAGRAQFFRSTKALKTSDKGGGGGEPGSPLSDAVGLNELEGAVLLDAEDYRRMLQEVKTLKSILLRLKRELAADGGVAALSPSSTPTKSGLKKETVDNNAELHKEIEKLTLERNKAKQELESSKKKNKATENVLEKLQVDLKDSEKEAETLKQRVEFLETHRESLLDKVERLHADKHNLEDRLNSFEKSAKYESSILNDEWMEGDVYDESIDNGFNYEDEDATY